MTENKIEDLKKEFDKKYDTLFEKLEGDGPMWFWNGNTQIYLRSCKDEVWQFIETALQETREEVLEIDEKIFAEAKDKTLREWSVEKGMGGFEGIYTDYAKDLLKNYLLTKKKG